MSNDLFIPANPSLVRGKKYQETLAANSNLSVRDRAIAPVEIPPPPVAEQVPVAPPAQRRNFGPGPINTSAGETRRKP